MNMTFKRIALIFCLAACGTPLGDETPEVGKARQALPGGYGWKCSSIGTHAYCFPQALDGTFYGSSVEDRFCDAASRPRCGDLTIYPGQRL
ncbi:MAG: hypothetical protein JNK82_44660 [Myxococcaceae bacterium]|nr:hypothetical protein [Myxococcaceae bacterium]